MAGPYRAPHAWAIEQNIQAAEHWAFRIWEAGGVALCPHLNTRNFQGALPDEIWLSGDLVMLERCDAILMLPGWTESKGSVLEHQHARDKEIKVFYHEAWGALERWLQER